MNAWLATLHRIALAAAVCLAVAPADSAADAITLDGVRHEGIYIRQTERLVYLHFPEDGRVEAVPREDLADDAVQLLPDEESRAALLSQWEQRRTAARATAASAAIARPVQRSQAQIGPVATPSGAPRPAGANPPGTTTEQEPREGLRSGVVDRLEVRDVPLRTALTAMLRPMGLDYAVRDGAVFISTPEVLRTEPWEPLEVRVYDIKNFDATLPKIVVRNPAGARSGPVR